ncbi:HAMP domain-containing protein [Thiorhodococcus mannitoliphagus]|uniref:histidine kinase n=1 Tax=Thiorhodococcus mannitoliphagus TaxID=329406 RepID=A0A6P1DZU5_9GAMM|nr:ATP-binding protein [Thiorhodococcus mannitoliphagus]NEX23219.1 HAMP domain-containing protein [Thiorhodococcus mannitoliphagus]
MRLLRRFVPATLFGRALLTLIFTFGAFALVTSSVIIFYALMPVAQRSAADLASIMVLSARTLKQLPPHLRDDYRTRLATEYQIRLAEERPLADSRRYFFPYLKRVEEALSQRLAREVEIVTSVANGERWFWAAIDVDGERLWTGFPRSRIGTRPLQGLTVIFVVAVVLIMITTVILAGRVSRPLRGLAAAAEQVALGFSPNQLPETGPRELANLAHQFNETSRQIRELLANRTMLLAGISHDLRTPLTRLRLAVAMLPEDTPPRLVARMERDIDEMGALITQAVELGKNLGAGRRELIDLSVLVYELTAGQPRVISERVPRCRCQIDALAVRRIVGNLLENALRYSQELVEVYLDCQSGRPVIFVLDRGSGIPEAELEAVLRPYYRLEGSRNRQTGGTGLGLAVAHQLALANQIELRLGRRRGGGTIASVRLPIQRWDGDAIRARRGVDARAGGA